MTIPPKTEEKILMIKPDSSVKMYRAVAKAGFERNKRHVRKSTQRLPSNVPFVVDNVWEWLRPENAPSRRHAVYASPTPALALQNASAGGAARENYVVCELVLHVAAIKLAHLNVIDARHHPDIKNVADHVRSATGGDSPDRSGLPKQLHESLYAGGSRKAELDALFNDTVQGRQLAETLRSMSSFWHDASLCIQPDSDGEMFFEIPEGGYFVLNPLEASGGNGQEAE